MSAAVLFVFGTPGACAANRVIDLSVNQPDVYISKTTNYGNFANMGGMAAGDVNGDGIKDLAASSLLEKIAKPEITFLPVDKDGWTESSSLPLWQTTINKNTALTADTLTYTAGTASISTTRTAPGSVNFKLRSSSGLSLNPAADILHFQVHAQDAAETLFYIDIPAPDYANRFRCSLMLPLNDSGWTQIDLPLSRFSVAGGSPDWNNVGAVILNFLGGKSGDIKIDAFYFDYNGPVIKKRGAVYLFFGPLSASMLVRQANVVIQGIDEGDLTGEYLDLKDLNNDGYKDIVIGVPYDDGPDNNRVDCGAVYIVLGSAVLPSVIDLKTAADYVIYGVDPGDLFGETVYAADLNGDSLGDLVIGAQNAAGFNNAGASNGEVHIIYGPFNSGGTLDLNSTASDITIYGKAYDFLGYQGTTAVGDIYNDGQKDLILGVYGADKAGIIDTGKVLVIDDISNYSGALDLASFTSAAAIYGADKSDRLSKVAVADFNNDGIDDIAAGAPYADGLSNSKADSGEVHVIFGSSTLPAVLDLNSTGAGMTILGVEAGDNLGLKLGAGDINNDVMSDIAMTAPGDDGAGNLKSECGAAYLVYGGPALTGTIDLNLTPADWVVYGADSGDHLRDIYSADISGDNIDDLVFGFRDADGVNNAYPDSGEIIAMKGGQ